jgi:hypothetical protein
MLNQFGHVAIAGKGDKGDPGTLDASTFAWQPPVLGIEDDAPDSPSNGDRYIVGDDPTPADDFDGHEGEIAQYVTDAWDFTVPADGWAVLVDGVAYYCAVSTGPVYTWTPQPTPAEVAAISADVATKLTSKTHEARRVKNLWIGVGAPDVPNPEQYDLYIEIAAEE